MTAAGATFTGAFFCVSSSDESESDEESFFLFAELGTFDDTAGLDAGVVTINHNIA